MYKILLMSAAGLALAACATTEDQTAGLDPDQMSDDQLVQTADGEIVRCRRVPQTGTRFHTRVCRTQEEWDRMATEARDVTRDITDGAEPYQGG